MEKIIRFTKTFLVTASVVFTLCAMYYIVMKPWICGVPVK